MPFAKAKTFEYFTPQDGAELIGRQLDAWLDKVLPSKYGPMQNTDQADTHVSALLSRCSLYIGSRQDRKLGALIELNAITIVARQSQILTTRPAPFSQNGLQAKSGFEMCFGLSTLGAGAKTRLRTPKAVTYHEQPHYRRFMIGHSLGHMESRIKKFTPHCVCRPT